MEELESTLLVAMKSETSGFAGIGSESRGGHRCRRDHPTNGDGDGEDTEPSVSDLGLREGVLLDLATDWTRTPSSFVDVDQRVLFLRDRRRFRALPVEIPWGIPAETALCSVKLAVGCPWFFQE